MPLTPIQTDLVHLLATVREPDSYLAGGAALHIEPNSIRYSQDLDYFHDSEKRVALQFQKDSDLLKQNKFKITIEFNQPGYIRAILSKGKDSTKIEWAHDSAWRFMPIQKSEMSGYILHPIDLAVNKLLALVGRDEPRDFIDICEIHKNVLGLGALVWAACGKDPGFNPNSILALLRRRGVIRPDDLSRLNIVKKINLESLKQNWLGMLDEAEKLILELPSDEVGCLYYSKKLKQFVTPHKNQKDVVPHFGKLEGIQSQFID